MKPKYLSFCGINSFSRKAEIDFEKLLSSGIFGIFGDTGSGKTTILDAMIFALYGRVDRIRGGNGNEIINSGCDKANVLFDFETETHDGRKIYRIEREMKRKNSAQSLTLSEVKGDKIVAVSDGVKNTNAKIQEIVGLSFEDFKKCIALPQGEFAQFVKAERADRLRLISRLFGLEKFGDLLNAKLRERLAAVRSDFDKKEGELRVYAEVSLELLSSLKKDANALKKRKAALDIEYAAAQKEFEQIKSAYERTCRRALLAEKLKGLQSRENEISDLEKKTQKFPAAKVICDARSRQVLREKEMQETVSASERVTADKTLAENESASLVKSFDKEKNRADAEQITATLAKLAYARNDAENLREIAVKRDGLRKDLRNAEAACKAASERLASYNAEEEKLGKALAAVLDCSLEEFLVDRLDSALLNTELRSAKEYFEQSRIKLHSEPERGVLFDRVDAELLRKISEYEGRLSGQKGADAAALLEKYNGMRKQREELVGKKNRIAVEKARAESNLKESEKERLRILEDGKKLSADIQKLENKIRAELDVEEVPDFSAMQAALDKKKRALQEDAERFEKQSERLRARIQEDVVERARLETVLERLRKEREEEAKTFASLLAESGFADLAAAQNLLKEIPDLEAAQKKINDFRQELLSVQANLRLLDEEKCLVSEEEYRQSEKKMHDLSDKKDEVTRSAAIYSQQIFDTEKRVRLKMQIEKELETERIKVERVEKLYSLVRGNAFMEFVAGEYLADISVSASKTLLELTGGRYFIRYKSGFVIIDNLCGGEERGVNTLSGGETFLVSLSLALALSSAIYAKSLRPIEFFFLDEGFGTLDEKLIDTVMDSLEKLKNNRFSIGLISHVEELKHRINNKITVTGAAEGGSSEIHINY